MVRIGTLPDVIILLGPFAILSNIGADLVVGQEAFGCCVRSRLPTAFPLFDAGAQTSGFLAAQRVCATVEGNADDQLVGRTAFRNPQFQTVVLRERGTRRPSETHSFRPPFRERLR